MSARVRERSQETKINESAVERRTRALQRNHESIESLRRAFHVCRPARVWNDRGNTGRRRVGADETEANTDTCDVIEWPFPYGAVRSWL